MNHLIFRKIASNEPVISYLSEVLNRKIKDKQKILWLIAGGSSLPLAVEVAKRLPKQKLQNLTVSLTDERYGPVNNPDSNWHQLEEAGFNFQGANLQPVLTGESMEQTSRAYAKSLWTNIEKCDYTIAFAGMGQDGHIFGIKPGSPSVKSNDLVEAYEWDDYARITPTFKLLRRLDEVVIYAAGKEKWPQLENLDHNLPDNDQPAQMLKRLKKVIIFNDYKGEPV